MQRHTTFLEGLRRIFPLVLGDPESTRLIAHSIREGIQPVYNVGPFPNLHFEQGADPVAGVDPAPFTVPPGRIWVPISYRIDFVAGVAVASRVPFLLIRDPSDIEYVRLAPAVSIAASQSNIMTWAMLAVLSTLSGSGMTSAMPLVVLPAGWDLTIVTANLQAADNFAAPGFTALEWFTDQVVQSVAP